MRYVIVDLEATCWEGGGGRNRMEIIEIGAVEVPAADAPPGREFAAFVRPTAEPILSDFCRELTTIAQADVDGAEGFPQVFWAFVGWIGPEPFTLCSWGQYDLNQFRADCRRHGVAMPATFGRHVNLKALFADLTGAGPMGMARALAHAGLPLVGTHHRGIDDARNLAALAALVLPATEGPAGAADRPAELGAS